MAKTFPEDWMLAEKRFEKRLRRMQRKKALRRQMQHKEPDFDYSDVLDLLYKATKVSTHVRKGFLHVTIPDNFSIIENPEKALDTMFALSTAARQQKRLKEIIFDHSDMERFDLAAEAVLDLIADEVKREYRLKRKKPRFRGRFPTDPRIARFIRGIGIISALNITHEMLDSEESRKLRIFTVRHKGRDFLARPERGNRKGEVVRRFVDHINMCLQDHGRKLKPAAIQLLSEYAGEILGNAEDHAGRVDWKILGYLDNLADPHMCEIAIFNFGKTIADTFQELPKEGYAYQQVLPYVEAHANKGFFVPTWTRADLLTLVALQGHISCKNNSEEDDRGQGTVELIEFFQAIHKECTKSNEPGGAQMAILSGGTHILFDGTYAMRSDNLGRKRIAFNKDNDLEEAPDKRFVRRLDGYHFPGTIISIRFPMQQVHTETLDTSNASA